MDENELVTGMTLLLLMSWGTDRFPSELSLLTATSADAE